MMPTILIVDDDAFLLDMYSVKFCEAKYQVDTAKSAEDALTRMRAGSAYDIVLLDMVMPKVTGLDLLKAMRDEALAGEPVRIVLSNQGEKSDIEAALDLGAVDYIVKANVIPSEVVAKVGQVFKEKGKKKAS